MKLKKIVLPLILLSVGIAIVAYNLYNKPHIDVADVKADVIVTAENLFTEFSTDEATANAEYLDKIIQVKGSIQKLSIENGIAIVTLKTEDDFGSVQCNLSTEAKNDFNLLKENELVTVKGICTGYLMDVVLVKSEIVNQ
jgi:DNA/RNA endonuclease YhcR with UshA esterase domain